MSEFKFPDESEIENPSAVNNADEVELEVVDDTPEEDRGKTMVSKYYRVNQNMDGLGVSLHPYLVECNIRIDFFNWFQLDMLKFHLY